VAARIVPSIWNSITACDIAPSAAGEPVKTPITTTLGRTFVLCKVGVDHLTGGAGGEYPRAG